MLKVVSFFVRLYKNSMEDDILTYANELTYKMLLAMFPFIIFIMTILGFLNLDSTLIYLDLKSTLPTEITRILNLFISEVIQTKSPSLLSVSFIIAIGSSCSGALSAIKGINRAYSQKETRNYIVVLITSLLIILFFACGVVAMVLVILFGGRFIGFFANLWNISIGMESVISTVSYIIVALFLVSITTMLYKIASCRKITFRNALPGSVVTVTMWILSTLIFSFYINNFSSYSMVYGTIGSIFILMFWLNIISVCLLVGAEINAIIEKKE